MVDMAVSGEQYSQKSGGKPTFLTLETFDLEMHT